MIIAKEWEWKKVLQQNLDYVLVWFNEWMHQWYMFLTEMNENVSAHVQFRSQTNNIGPMLMIMNMWMQPMSPSNNTLLTTILNCVGEKRLTKSIEMNGIFNLNWLPIDDHVMNQFKWCLIQYLIVCTIMIEINFKIFFFGNKKYIVKLN